MITNTFKKPGFDDLTGKTFGLLKVMNRVPNTQDACGTSRTNYKVMCCCGLTFITKGRYLRRGKGSCSEKMCKKTFKELVKKQRPALYVEQEKHVMAGII